MYADDDVQIFHSAHCLNDDLDASSERNGMHSSQRMNGTRSFFIHATWIELEDSVIYLSILLDPRCAFFQDISIISNKAIGKSVYM